MHLILLALVTGCFWVGQDDYDAVRDRDQDGAVDSAFGGPDCDREDPDVHPGATEVCDGIDNDCDGVVDPPDSADASTWFVDGDGDGFGDPGGPQQSCQQPSGYVDATLGTDCDDNDAEVHPEASEVCNGIDDDCDALFDEDDDSLTGPSTWYPDLDGDGFGDPEGAMERCTQPSGTVTDGSDCDDDDPEIHPDADEHCDHVDNDCDGQVDLDYDVYEGLDTIQGAIDMASEGEGICVWAGTYYENIFFDKSIVLLGEDRDTTIIDGAGTDRVLELEFLDETARIGNFTLTNGFHQHGAGLDMSQSFARLEDLLIEGNRIEDDDGLCSGVIYFYEGGPTLDRIEVRNNSADCLEVRGMVQVGGGTLLLKDEATATMRNIRITDNTTVAADYAMGALVSWGAILNVDNLIVAGNIVELAEGGNTIYGAAFTNFAEAITTVTNATFHDNAAHGGSGTVLAAVHWAGNPDLSGYTVMSNVSVTDNTVTGDNVDGWIQEVAYNWSYSNFYGQSEDHPLFVEGDEFLYGVDNIQVEPGYTDTSDEDPARWDFTLRADSELVDAGDPEIEDVDGTRSDIGAHGGPGGETW